MDKIRKRLSREIELRQMDMKQLSLALGKNHAYVQQFLTRGIPARLKEQDRRKLSELLDIPENELGGPKPASSSAHATPQFRTITEYDIRASAGDGALTSEENVRSQWPFDPSYLSDFLGLSTNDLAIIEVRGDSMEPTLSSGDRVMVHLADKQISQPGIFIIYDGGGTVIKRVEKIPGQDKLVLISDNPLHTRYEISGDDVQIVGRVVWAAKRL
ncbi:S24/S26 family peptidase [Pararhizobium sp. IMCC21322]|uniref:S24 family peptidase n=1 Tax=Pararhizobium sp. IMCC21322 TaxID=3067903 RepID=UPI002741078B|nr:S24/S26 family peptidase [Pararhizobium sp. IMCC21322]